MLVAFLLVGSLAFLIHYLLNSKNNFWEKYGVRQIENSTLVEKFNAFFGKKALADFDEVAYKEMAKTGLKFVGVVELQQPMVVIKDLDVIKKVMIKDFDHFVDRRRFASDCNQEVVNKMLIIATGDEWKGLRSQLSPTFTTGKIRRMMEHFNTIGAEWVNHLKEGISANGGHSMDVKIPAETTHFTTDVIAAAVFGMKAGTIRNPESFFSKMVHRLGDFTTLDVLKFGLSSTFPKIFKMTGMNILDGQSLDFFSSIFTEGLKARKAGNVKANDFIQLLVEARKGELKSVGSDELSDFEKEAEIKDHSKKRNYLDDDLVATAQAVNFFFAGFSTVSNIIGFVMYMLALNPEVQDKLRAELNSKLFSKVKDENIDYDELNELPYLEMIICEVLRKYPPLDRLDRICTKEYHDAENKLKMPKGSMAIIPLRAIHNDKQFYDHPDKFYPEHFTPENKAKRNHYSYMPFGHGARNCIGMRFALVETKAAVAHIVHNFVIEPCANTPIPVKVKILGPGVQIPDDLELKLKLIK